MTEGMMTDDRASYVLSLAKKKVDAALAGVPGMHFRVYPPHQYIEAPGLLSRPGIHAALADTVWWVHWHDGAYDPLSFVELIFFVRQILWTKQAILAAAESRRRERPKHAGGWQPKKDRSRPNRDGKATVTGRLSVQELTTDEGARRYLAAVALEPTARPQNVMN